MTTYPDTRRAALGGGRRFVGRERELAQLTAAVTQAVAGHGGVVAICGEEGIGKTALVRATAVQAREVTTAWANCSDHLGSPPYWGWIQILERLDPATAELLEPRAKNPALIEPVSARRALFRRVEAALRQQCETHPLLLVLEDLQGADGSTLLLLAFIARRVAQMRLLLICTWREPVAPQPGSEATYAALQRDATVIRLGALDEWAVAALVEHQLGTSTPLAVVRAIHRDSEGHPLLAAELARLQFAAPESAGAATARTLPLPQSLKVMFRNRLRALPESAIGALRAAAVLGREFDLKSVSVVAQLPEVSVATAAMSACSAGVLEALEEDLGRYRFSHDGLRRTLLEELLASQRAALHMRAAQRLRHDTARAAELAHHLRHAVPEVSADEAAEWSWRAAREALAVLAYEDAAAHAAGALQLGIRGRRRVELLILLGEAQLYAGDTRPARETLRQAALDAKRLEAADLQARAALALGGGAGPWAAPRPDAELLELLQKCLAARPPAPLRTRLLARLAEEHVAARDFTQAERLSREALQSADRTDSVTTGFALRARLLTTLPAPRADQRAELVQELENVAVAASDPAALYDACLWGLNAALEQADGGAVRRHWHRLHDVATRTQQPHQLWTASVTAAMLALLDGRLLDAEENMQRALREGQEVVPLVQSVHGTQLIALRREQGRLRELESLVRDTAANRPDAWGWRVGWAGMLCELGRDDAARRELADLPTAAFEIHPDDYEWPSRLTLLAEVCARLGDRPRATRLYDALLSHRGEVVIVSFSVLCRGAADRYLGLLAATVGAHDRAQEHFDAAQRLHAGLASPLWRARTEADRARARAAVGDIAGAAAAADAALTIADEAGLASVAAVARAAKAATPAPRARGAPAAERLVFRREGKVWAIGDPTAPARLPDRRGLGYMAALLAEPGRELAAAELAGAATASTQPALDSTAKHAYRARLQELSEDIARAERIGDAERAALGRAEFDALAAEVSRAVGLRGRDRRLAEPAERARSSVTKAIRSAIHAVAQHDPALAQHLDAAVRTGAFCRYVPDVRHPISWRVTM